MGGGEFLILHNVKQCDLYTDNVIVVSHLLLASRWTATLDGGIISPRTNTFRLERVTCDHLVGMSYDERQLTRLRMLVVTENHAVPRGPPPGESYALRPHRKAMCNLGNSPLVASALPPRLLFDIALSGLHVGQVLDFINRHISHTNAIVAAQWLEQPAVSMVNRSGAESARLASYVPNAQDDEVRLFSMYAAPLCPGWSTMRQRRDDGSSPISVLQRDRMTDKVPLLLEDVNAVHVNIVVTPPGPPRAEGTVPAADNGNSAFNYINEKWVVRMGIGWETPNAEKVFVDQVNGLDLPCLLYTSPSPRDLSTSRMPSSA